MRGTYKSFEATDVAGISLSFPSPILCQGPVLVLAPVLDIEA